MPLITWLRASVSGTFRRSARRNPFLPRARWHGYTLAIEALEDRTLPSTFLWTGLGGNANWDNASNWTLTTGTGSFPNAAGDIAQFVVLGGGAETARATVTVDVPITVGEIDFGTSSNISITGANNLTLQGSGSSALLDVGEANLNAGMDTITAPLVVTAATPLSVTVAGSDSLSLSGQVSGGGGLTKNGTGTLNLNAAVNNSYSGTTTVNAGALTASGPSATGTSNVIVNDGGTLTASGLLGTLVNSASLTVNTGGTLELDNTLPAGNNTDRIGDMASLNLNGGMFTYIGAANSSSTETIGNVTLGPGSSTISSTAGTSGKVALTFGSLIRNAGATINFQAGSGQTLGSASNQILFTTAPTLDSGILPGATVTDATRTVTVGSASVANPNGFNLATVTGSATPSIVALTTYQALSATGGNTGADNVLVTSSTILAATAAVNAVLIVGDNITITPGVFNLDVGSGLVASSDTGTTGNTIATGTLAFETEGCVLTDNGTLTLSGTLIGSNGLTMAGTGVLVLPNANSSYTGTSTLASGTLSLGNSKSLSTGPLNLVGGTLQASGGITLANSATLDNAAVTFAGTNPLTLAGTVALAGTNVITANNSAGTTIAGPLSGAGSLILATASLATLMLSNGTNTYSGSTQVLGGTLDVAASNALPASSSVVVGAGGTLILPGGVTDTVAGFSLQGGTLSGGGTLTSTSTYDVESGTTSVNLAGNVGLTKSTAGTVTLDGTDSYTYTGTTAVNAGTLAVDGILTVSQVSVTAGATLTGTGSITGAVTAARGTNSTGGIVAPGSGTFSTGNLSLDSSSFFTSVLNGSGAGQFGQVQATGGVNLNSDSGTGSTLNLTLAAGFTPAVGQTFDIITYTAASLIGNFNGLPESSTFARGGFSFRINYAVTVSTGLAVQLTAVAGPPAQVVFGVQSANTTAGAAITPAVTVKIEDQFGNLVSSDSTDQVTVGIASGPGNFTTASTVTVTASSGIATFSNLHLNTTGTYTLSERVTGGLTGPASSSFTVTPAAVNQLVFGAQPANTTAGAAITPAVTVQIEDQFGNVVTSDNTDTVSVSVASGPGTFVGSKVGVTVNAGVATFSNLHLTTAGSYTLGAGAAGLTAPPSNSFTVTPAAANQLVFGQQPSNTTAGTAITPAVTVKIEDQFGNLVSTDNTDQVTVGIASGPGTFSGASTTTVTASSGIATFSNLHLNTAGSYTLSETASAGHTGPASNSFMVTPAAANHLVFGVQPSNTTAGAAIAPAVTVQIEDQFGNLVSTDISDQVTVGIASGPGTFAGSSTTTVTASGGIATFSNLHLNTAGSYTLSETASAALTGPASNSLMVTPAGANQLVFGVQPSNITAGAAIAPAVTVLIEDPFGNLVSSDSTDLVTVGIATGPGSSSASSTMTVTASSGIATFSNLHLNTAGTYTLSENASGGLAGPVSNSFTVTPAAANRLAFGVQPSNITAGAAIAPAVTVKIEDPFGNLVSTDSSDQVTVGITSGPGSFSGASTTTVTASGGVATFSNLHLNTAGSYTLSETASGSLTGLASSSFTITPAVFNQLVFGQQPTNTTAGTVIAPAVTVRIEDSFGNLLSSDSTDQVTIGVVSGPGNFSGSTTIVTASGGIATFSTLHLNTAGSYTLSERVSDELTGPASNSFTVRPAGANQLVFGVQPANTTAGVAIAPAVTVQIEDPFGNLVSSDNTDLVTVGIATGPGSSSASSTITMMASGGIATFSNLHLNTAGTYTLSENASGGLAGPVSNSFTVTPAAANQLVFGVQPSNTTAGIAIAPAVTVRIEDQFGNLVSSDSTDQVTVGIASGPSSFTGSSTITVTAGSGVATFSNLVLNTAGSYTLSETATSSLTGPASSSFTVTPAAANQLVFGQRPLNSAPGNPLTPAVTVKIEDAFGNLLSGDSTDQVTVGIASGQGTFSRSSTTIVTGSAGIATFSNLVLNTPGTYTLSETASGGLTGPASSSFMVIETPTATSLAFGVQPGNTTAGAAISPAVTVQILDQFGNPFTTDSTDQVTLAVATGPGSFTVSSTTIVTVSAGMATFSNLHLNTAGSYTLSETATGGLTGAPSNGFTVTPAGANQLVFGKQPTNTTAGTAITPAVTVLIEDPFGNLVSTDNIDQVTIGVVGGPGSFTGGSTTTLTASRGVATFSNLHLNTTGSYTLSENATGALTGPVSNSFTVTPAAANQLVFAQQPANAMAGAAIRPAVTVKIEDQFGNLVSSDSIDQVTVGIVSGPGVFSGSSMTTVTASAGVATFSNLHLNTAGSYTLSETASSSLTGTNSSSFTVTPAAANQLVFGQQPSNTTAGTAIAPAVTVRIEDQFGNLLSSDSTDQVTIGIASGPGTISGSTTIVTASGGIATFSALHLNTAGSYTLSERASGGLTGPASSSFTVTPAAANQLVFGVQPANTTAGVAIAPAVTVQIEDPFGNVVSSDSTDQVTVGIASGPGSFSGSSTTTVTASGGIATFSNLHLNTAGSYTLSETATSSLAGPNASSFTITPAAANQLVFGQQPANTTAGMAIAPAVTVKIEDQFGNLVSSDNTDTVTVGIASGPGSLSGGSTTTLTASAGIATFSNLHLNMAGSYTLSQTASGGLTGPASSNFTVTPAAANQLVFGQQPANTTAGAALTPAVTVRIEDPFGNLVTSDSTDQVTVGIASGPGTFAGTSTLTATAVTGVATFANLRLSTAGTYALSETATGGLTGASSSGFTVTPAAVNQLVFGVQPANTTAGVAIAPAVTVRIEDSFGNLVSSDSTDQVTIAIATGPGNFTGSSTTTVMASGGVATFSNLVLNKAGSGYNLSAIATGSLTGPNSNSFTVTPARATHLVVLVPSSGSTAGSPVTVTVTALDSFNNTATGYSGMVHFSSSDPAAILPADSPLTRGTGSFNVLFETAGPQTVTATDTIVASLTARSAPSVVSAAAPTQLVVNVPSSADAGSPVTVTVSVLDSFNNLATGYTGTVHFTSSDPLATLPANYTFTVGPGGDNGTHAFSVIFGTPVNQTLAVTDLATGRITSTTEVPVLPAGALDPDVEKGKPGLTATASSAVGLTSVTLTVFYAALDGNDIKALTAILPLLPYATAPVAPAGTLTLAAYEVRVLHPGDNDVADVVFTFPAGPDPTEVPVVQFSQDPQAIPFQPIRPLRTIFLRDGLQSIVEVVFSRANLPTVRQLDGTVFTITVSVPAPPVPITFSPPVASADAPAAGLVSTATFQSTSQLTLTLSASQASQVSISRSTLIPTGGGGGDDITAVRGDTEMAWLRILVEALGDYADTLWQYGNNALRRPPQRGRPMPPSTPTQVPPPPAGPEPEPPAPQDQSMAAQDEALQPARVGWFPEAWSGAGQPGLAERATIADPGRAESWWGLAASLVGMSLRAADVSAKEEERRQELFSRRSGR